MINNKTKRYLSYALFVICCLCIAGCIINIAEAPSAIMKWIKLACYILFAFIFFRNYRKAAKASAQKQGNKA